MPLRNIFFRYLPIFLGVFLWLWLQGKPASSSASPSPVAAPVLAWQAQATGQETRAVGAQPAATPGWSSLAAQGADASRSAETAQAFASLLAQAQTSGPVRVIIGLRVPFQAEGALADQAAVQSQRSAIAQAQEALLRGLAVYNVDSVKRFDYIPFLAMEVDEAGLRYLAASTDVASIQEDRAVPPALAESIPLIGAPAAWASGFTGAGQTIAILDTGVDKNHPFLAGKVVSEACYSTTNSLSTSVCPGGVSQSTSSGSGVNCSLSITGCEHGTHVAGIAAGQSPSFSGVAKDASLIAIQVFSRFDSPTDCGSLPTPCALTYDSDYIRGLERVQTLSGSFKIAAVNLSLGGGRFSSNCDAANAAAKTAIDNLRSLGIATVAASGNNGYTDSMGSPACISSAISVGSTGDGSLGAAKDVVVSSSNSASFLNLLAPGQWINSSVPGGGFENFSGTSMAAPHVAGAWAVLKSKAPTASVAQVLSALTSTGVPVTDGRNGITKPRIQVDAALSALSGNPPSPGQTEELKTDDGTAEVGLALVNFRAVVNRLTPSSYPATLQKIKIAFFPFTNQPNPTGQAIRLLVATDPFSSGRPPSGSQFLTVETTVPGTGDFFEFTISNGPTLTSGDFYIGYQAPIPHNGVGFAIDANSQPQNRTFFSDDNGNLWQGPISPPSGGSSANALIRAIVSVGGGSTCTFTLSPANQNFPATGGNGTVSVTTQSGCNWTATKTDTWITITSGSSGSGNGQVNYSVAANTSANQRTGIITIVDKTFTITQGGGGGDNTFSNSSPITINDNRAATPYPSNISVSGLTGTVSKVTVTLNNLTHTFPDDIDILLVGPTGQSLILMSDSGGGSDINNLTLTFDDQAAAALPDSSSLTAGTFKPTNHGSSSDTFPAPAPSGTPTGTALSVFNGTNPNGTWSLYVVDDADDDAGSIAGGWSVALTMGGQAPNPVIDVQPASLSFGSVNVGGTADQTLTVRNTGTAPLNVTNLTSSNARFSVTTATSFTVAPGGQQQVTVRFSPNAGGTQTGTLTIASNDPNRPTVSVSLSGEGAPACPTITLSPAALPSGTIGAAYNQTITASGGTAPYNFTLSAGSLPGGLTLSANGVLSGTPTQKGSFNFTVKATDANGCMGTQAYSLVINCPTVTLSPTTLPGGTVGAAYNQTISASPAGGNYSFAVTAGALPAGLSLNAATGALTGTPTTAGTANFTITATGFGDCAGSQAYTLSIQSAGGNCVPVSISTSLVGATGTMLTVPITVGDLTSKGVIAYDFSLSFDPSILRLPANAGLVDQAGTLSSAMTINAVSGAPGQLSVSAFGVQVLSGAGTLLNLKFELIGATSACSNLTWISFKFNEGNPCATTAHGRVCLVGGSIAGTVNYGTAATPQPVPGVVLTAAGTPPATATTTSAGNYQLTNLGGGPYTVTPAKTGDVNGISSFDAGLVAQHALKIITLTPRQQIAGDASNDGNLSSFDAALIAQAALNIPNPSSIVGTWKFEPGSRAYPSLSGQQTNQNFEAILVGDVSGNWLPPAANAAASAAIFARLSSQTANAVQVPVSLPNLAGAPNASVTIPVTVGDLTGRGIISFDFDLLFNPSVLQLQSPQVDKSGTLSSAMNINAVTVAPGHLKVSAFGTSALAGAGTLVNLKFSASGAPGSSTPLTWQSFFFNEDAQTGLTNGRFTVNAPAAAPTVTTAAASAIATTSATLNGSANANGAATEVAFEWGTSSTLENFNTTPAQSLGAGNVSQSVSANLTGLAPGTAYFYRLTASNSLGAVKGSILSFTTLNPPPPARTVRVVNAAAAPSGTVKVAVALDAQGDETGLQFSLVFDPSLLRNPQVALGGDAQNAQFFEVNDAQAAQGRLGFLLLLKEALAPGARQIALITFTAAPVTAETIAAIGFDNKPIPPVITDANAGKLAAVYTPGAVTILLGFEADVDGDLAVTVADAQQVMLFAAGKPTLGAGSLFQRADSAPRETKGDGLIDLADVVQAMRYAANKDGGLTPAGGPAEPVSAAALAAQLNAAAANAESAEARLVRAVNTSFRGGQTNSLTIQLDARGDEAALGFSVNFDPHLLRFLGAEAGSGATSAMLMVNDDHAASGRVGILLALPGGQRFAAGSQALVTLRFTALSGGPAVITRVSFGDDPIRRQLADENAHLVPAAFADVAITINARAVSSVSAASFSEAGLAAEAIASAFGTGLATATQTAERLPLPLALAGTTVSVRDSAGVERLAPLFFVSPDQVNYQIPAETASGTATITIISGDGSISTGTAEIADVAPSLFAANANGQGVAAAVAVRVTADGAQSYEAVARFDSAQGKFVAAPLELGGESEQVFLVLFGAGIRAHGSLARVSVRVGGEAAAVLYAGPQGEFAGLDQVNVRLPRSLAGRGEMEVRLALDGKAANPVKVNIR
jgi:subtilisin